MRVNMSMNGLKRYIQTYTHSTVNQLTISDEIEIVERKLSFRTITLHCSHCIKYAPPLVLGCRHTNSFIRAKFCPVCKNYKETPNVDTVWFEICLWVKWRPQFNHILTAQQQLSQLISLPDDEQYPNSDTNWIENESKIRKT